MLAKTMAAERKERRKKSRTTNTMIPPERARPRRSVSCARMASLSSSSRIRRTPPGWSGASASRRSLTRSATATALVPISFCTVNATAGKPSMR